MQWQSSSTNSPASQHRVDDEHDVGRLLADGSAKVVIPPLADQQQLCQAGGKDGAAQQSAAEDEGQEEAVVPLQCTTQILPATRLSDLQKWCFERCRRVQLQVNPRQSRQCLCVTQKQFVVSLRRKC